MKLGVAIAGSYLLGSLPVANAVARRSGLADLRQVGDRNPGYWNAMTQLGARRAWPVLVGDAGKGAAAAALGRAVGPWWGGYACAGAAMIGHAWPVFARFRGGRSVATFTGAMPVLAPSTSIGSTALGGATWASSRRVERAIRVGVFALPVVQLAVEGPRRTAATGALMTIIGVRFAQAAREERVDAQP